MYYGECLHLSEVPHTVHLNKCELEIGGCFYFLINLYTISCKNCGPLFSVTLCVEGSLKSVIFVFRLIDFLTVQCQQD